MAKKKYDNSGVKDLFPETADEGAAIAVADSESKLTITSSACLGKSANEAPSDRCCPAPGADIASAELEDESKQLVDSHEGRPETQQSDHIPSFDQAGGPNGQNKPLIKVTKPSENSEPHDGAGTVTPVSVDTIRDTTIDTGSSKPSYHGPDELIADEISGAEVQPSGAKSFDIPSEDSREPDSLAISEAAEQSVESANDSTSEAGEQTDLGLPQGEEERAALSDRTQAGLHPGDSRGGAADQSKASEALPLTERTVVTEESKVASLVASGPGKSTGGPTPGTNTTKPTKRRQSHPTVITEERDCLGTSEEEILDQLIALKRQQYGAQSSPTDEVEAGYSDLLTEHATCTKTVQRNIPKLVKKGFIVRTNRGNKKDTYRVKPEQEVKKERLEKALTHYVQIGPGRKAVSDPEKNGERND